MSAARAANDGKRGEDAARASLRLCPSGHGASVIHEALGFYCRETAPVSMLDAAEPPGCLAGGVTTRADVAPRPGTEAPPLPAEACGWCLSGQAAVCPRHRKDERPP